MDTQELKDSLGNTLRVGDTVAYSMVCRHAPPVSFGVIASMGHSAVSIASSRTRATVRRLGSYVVKAVVPDGPQ